MSDGVIALACPGPQNDGLAVGGEGELGAEEDLPGLAQGQAWLRLEDGPRPSIPSEEKECESHVDVFVRLLDRVRAGKKSTAGKKCTPIA